MINGCNMRDWDQIHWLKLLSLLAASISEVIKFSRLIFLSLFKYTNNFFPQDFNSSVNLICELLTDDATSGLSSTPFWMFKEFYTFLASLDYSSEREIKIDDS